MKAWSFTIIASGLDPATPGFADRFFEAGCDDATIAFQKGLIVLEFDREARNFAHALLSAMEDVRRAGAKIERVEPDHLVSASDIAKRADLGRAATSLYAKGERGKGFPVPVARITTDSPLWDWLEVAAWLFRRKKLPLNTVVQARMVKEVNVVLGGERAPSRLGRAIEHRHIVHEERVCA